jgi:hypothetical protein
MTFQRRKLKRVSAEQFVEDIAKNDAFLFPPGASNVGKSPLRFFRYPQVRANKDPQKRAEVSAWLKKKGYLDAPVSVGGKDAQFSQVYCAALARDDRSCANFVKAVYISTLMERTVQARKAANELGGHEAKLIVGVGANQLICDSLGEILDAYKARGVRFISLSEALKDPLYSAGDVWETARLLQRATKRALRKAIKQR